MQNLIENFVPWFLSSSKILFDSESNSEYLHDEVFLVATLRENSLFKVYNLVVFKKILEIQEFGSTEVFQVATIFLH